MQYSIHADQYHMLRTLGIVSSDLNAFYAAESFLAYSTASDSALSRIFCWHELGQVIYRVLARTYVGGAVVHAEHDW